MIDRIDENSKEKIDKNYNYLGPLTLPTGVVGHAFLSTSSVQKTGIDWPDLQVYMLSVGMYENFAKDIASFTRVRQELLDEYVKPHLGKDAFALMINLARVKSTGELTLADKNPLSKPIIDPRYLENPHDLKVLVEGLCLIK